MNSLTKLEYDSNSQKNNNREGAMAGRDLAAGEVGPVIIVGAGPVGLGAALELARCGLRSILIERNERTSWHPKTRNFNTRTMEIARGWGREIYDELRHLD